MSTDLYHVNPSPRATGFANASIILAATSLVAGPLTAIPAIVFGHKALARINKNPAIHGFGRGLAGTILGYLFLILFLLVFFETVYPDLAH